MDIIENIVFWYQVTVNRKRKLEQLAPPDGQPIHELIQKLRAKRRGLATSTACPPPSLPNIPLLPPSSPIEVLRLLLNASSSFCVICSLYFYNSLTIVRYPLKLNQRVINDWFFFLIRYAKAYERPRETKDCSPQVIEEYILEPAESQDYIKLSILQRPATSEYLGELFIDKNPRDGEKNGSSCRYIFDIIIIINISSSRYRTRTVIC